MNNSDIKKIPLRDLLGSYEHKGGKVWSVTPTSDRKFQISYGRKNFPPNETQIVDAKEALRRTLSKIKGGFQAIGGIVNYIDDLDHANICFNDVYIQKKSAGLIEWLKK